MAPIDITLVLSVPEDSLPIKGKCHAPKVSFIWRLHCIAFIILYSYLEHTVHVAQAAGCMVNEYSSRKPPLLFPPHSTISQAAPAEPSSFQHARQGSVGFMSHDL